ncbi:MAG: bifunctional UDP-sugar hydrolase/5'-nucleotidase [Candidatus Izemoplasmatales bacterium]
MKKLLILFALVFTVLTVSACQLSNVTTTSTVDSTTSTSISNNETSDSTTTSTNSSVSTTISTSENVIIDLYSMNDFHGGAYSSINTLSNVAAYLDEARSANPYTVFLSTGDMLQGTAFSNYYYGRPIIEILDDMGLVGFTLGNHEFDWGIDKIAEYSDLNQSNGEASYPFVAANIVYEDTLQPLPFTVPYTITEINGVRIGVIGVIGNVINSISASRVENIVFLDPADTVYKYADILRTEQDCDIVVASIHDYDQQMNSEIASFTGTHYVDAIFNGHSHTNVASSINRSGVSLPYAQASNYSNSLLTKISLVYNNPTGKVTSAYAYVLDSSDLDQSSSTIDAVINTYTSDPVYTAFVTDVLAYTPNYIDKYDMGTWGASVIRDYMGVDFGMLNSGGFRVSIPAGNITMGKMVEVYPFDNYLKKVELLGSALTDLYFSGYDVVFDDSITSSGGNIYKNGVLIQDNQYYSVAAVDYIFDKDYYPFLSGRNIEQTTFLMRDLLVQDLRNTVGNFSPFNGTSYPGTQNTSFYSYYYNHMRDSVL